MFMGGFLAACLLLLLLGCGDKAKDLYATAQLEEKQNNGRTRRSSIGTSSQEYPGSPYANQAKSRLAELEKPR